MFLIRRNGICLPDECSWVSLQGRQFGEKGSPFQLLTHQINIQLRSTFIHCHWKCCFLTALIWEFLQSGVKAKSLVAQALTNTNSNIFNVSLSLVTTRCKSNRDKKVSLCNLKEKLESKNVPRLSELETMALPVPTNSRNQSKSSRRFPLCPLDLPPSLGDLCLVLGTSGDLPLTQGPSDS